MSSLVSVWNLRSHALGELFGDPKLPLQLDLGTGLGHFTADMAIRHANFNWIGLEYEPAIAHRAATRIDKLGLKNARIIPLDARLFLYEHCGYGQFEHIWLNFPDPWPKDRHQDRRHTNPWMIRLMTDRIALGGGLHLATDIVEFANDLSAGIAAQGTLDIGAKPPWERQSLPVRTKYERKWLSGGKSIHYADWLKPNNSSADSAFQVERSPSPNLRWQPHHTEGGQVAIDGKVAKIFRSRGEGQIRFLLVDAALGLETYGFADLETGVTEINGVWTAWKIGLLQTFCAK